MPFRFPFMPYGYNNYRRLTPQYSNYPANSSYSSFSTATNSVNYKNSGIKNEDEKKHSEAQNSEYFFELFGMKLYFDDVLIICILLFLYNEQVHDQELFICLVLLLIS